MPKWRKLTPHSTAAMSRREAALVRLTNRREHRSAPEFALLLQELVSYLFEPSLISAFSVAPRARAYFLPAKRTPVTIALPLEWSTSAAS